MADKFNFTQLKTELQTKVKKELPSAIAASVRNYMLAAFRDQGLDGNKWAEVQRRIPETKEWKYPKGYGLQRRTNPIGRGGGFKKGSAGGTLRRGVSNSLAKATFELISFHVKTPYAGYFNDGTENMEARPFNNDSPVLHKLVEDGIDKYMTAALEKGV
jgi:hypothetical protein